MSEFNHKLKDYLTIYKTPIAPDRLDPSIFFFPETGETPRLLPGVHAQIINDLTAFVGDQPSRITKALIVGSAVTPGSKRTEDLTVLIVLNKQLMDIDIDGILGEEILKLTDALSGKLVGSSLRKIRYLPVTRNLEQLKQKYSAIFDVQTNEWIKTPDIS